MSHKMFCDLCKKEVKDTMRFTCNPRKGLMVEIITGWNGTWNAGHFHRACILREVSAMSALIKG